MRKFKHNAFQRDAQIKSEREECARIKSEREECERGNLGREDVAKKKFDVLPALVVVAIVLAWATVLITDDKLKAYDNALLAAQDEINALKEERALLTAEICALQRDALRDIIARDSLAIERQGRDSLSTNLIRTDLTKKGGKK